MTVIIDGITVKIERPRVHGLAPRRFIVAKIHSLAVYDIIQPRVFIPNSGLKMQMRPASNPVISDISDDVSSLHGLIYVERLQRIHVTVSCVIHGAVGSLVLHHDDQAKS
jgi:hypothetical protein